MSSARILFIGDVVGEPGRRALESTLPRPDRASRSRTSSSRTGRTWRGLGITERTANKLLTPAPT
jgi:calcineurin-like phosphoesterase